MTRLIICLGLLLGCGVGLNAVADPLDKAPRIQRLIDTVAPEVYDVKISLTDGKVVELEKVALTERSLQRRFSLNSVDKTMRVLPKGETERITLNVSEIEKIEITRVKPQPKPEPEKKPV
jgi:hypothetical protein